MTTTRSVTRVQRRKENNNNNNNNKVLNHVLDIKLLNGLWNFIISFNNDVVSAYFLKNISGAFQAALGTELL